MENDPEMVLADLAEEVLQVSDRILVLARGQVRAEFDRESIDRAKLLHAPSIEEEKTTKKRSDPPEPGPAPATKGRWAAGLLFTGTPVGRALDTIAGKVDVVLGKRGRLLARVPPEAALVVMLGLLVAWFSSGSPFFLTVANLRNILIAVSVLGVLSAPLTMLLVARNFDLSVASAAAFSGMVLAQATGDHGLEIAIVLAVLAGLGVGLLNGFLVAGVGINSIIATLGTLSIFRGLTKVMANGQTIRMDGFTGLGSGEIIGVPAPIIVFAAVAIAFLFVMRSTVFGRTVYAIGGNPEAARLAGIRVERFVFLSFALSGLLAALAGLILVSQLRAASPIAGEALTLTAVAAVILGGTSLAGGRGTIIGTVLGVLILGTLNNGLTITNVSAFWQEVARGVVLVLAVGIDQIRLRLARR